MEPEEIIIKKAKERKVPVIIVSEDTLTTMDRLKELFGKARLRGEEKVKRIVNLVKTHVNVKEILEYIL